MKQIVVAALLALLHGAAAHAQTACQTTGDPRYPVPGIARSWTNCDLSAVDFRGDNLASSTFTNDQMPGAVLLSVNLSPSSKFNTVDLRNSILAKADLTNASLTNVNFAGADLRNANFSNAFLTGVDFTGADLRWANFRHAIIWQKVTFDKADLTYATWTDGTLCPKPTIGPCKK